MITISQADEDLFRTVTVAAKLGRAGKIVSRLGDRYADDWDDPHAGFPYALAMVADFYTGGAEMENQAAYIEVLETLGDLLYGVPDHWLGRYLRIWLRAIVPADFTGHQRYLAGERVKAMEEAEELLDRQSQAEWQPWFAATHVLVARMIGNSADRDTDRMTKLVRAAAASTNRPIPFRSLGAVLSETFVAYYHQTAVPERETVGKLMVDLFPSQPVITPVPAGFGPS